MKEGRCGKGLSVASEINVKNGALCVTGNWPGSRCFAIIEGQRPPLWRLAISLGMDGASTLEEVQAALAHKSWDGQNWADDEVADLNAGATDRLKSL
jgi:hypothetical protein